MGHLHLQNHLKALLDEHKNIRVRVIFNCADCYISPTVYEKKLTTGEVVPTWNFVSAQVTGSMTLVESEAELKNILSDEVDFFEQSVGSSWRLRDSPETYVTGLLKGIFGVQIRVNKFTVHKKLHQKNTPRKEVENVTEWCAVSTPERRMMRPWMEDYLSTMHK